MSDLALHAHEREAEQLVQGDAAGIITGDTSDDRPETARAPASISAPSIRAPTPVRRLSTRT